MEKGAEATGDSVSVKIPQEVTEAGITPVHHEADLVSSAQKAGLETRGAITEHHIEPSNLIEFTNISAALKPEKGENENSASRWRRIFSFKKRHEEEEVKNVA